jgi:hypothetical protein
MGLSTLAISVLTISRKDVHRGLERIRHLRNRIARHEPIIGRDLLDDYEHLLKVALWLSPLVPEWIENHSRVRAVIDTGVTSGLRY